MGLKHMTIAFLTLLLFASSLWAAEATPAKPGSKDKCPVCGMFVYKYPDWVGQIAFKDGSAVFFDGAKDLFKYYFNLKKYNPAKTAGDIAAIWVTEYYELAPLEAKAAFFVVGSNVFGPMGKELIPFQSLEAAQEFKKDHGGTEILTFGQINPPIISKLD
ncbi:MAG: nitrous oxide reductase accessory protein NosL [Desulfobacterales bacterium]|jgi:nitrous oxide reductase accessory protein NosL|nr:nitrous oxide reductase accessory protein NosL [Desulfobacterales bacterium]